MMAEPSTHRTVALLAAGDPPQHPVALQALAEADAVVCCDSAYMTLLNLKFETLNLNADRCTVVGDGDSLSPSLKLGLGERYVQVDEQEYNDLVKAMRWAVQHYGTEGVRYTLLGLTGRREDHTLANLSHLGTFAEWWPELAHSMSIVTDYGVFDLVCGRRRFSSFERQQVSLFALDTTAPVTVKGLQYPICGRCLTRLWQGSLNAAMGSTFEVEGWQLLVYRTHEPK